MYIFPILNVFLVHDKIAEIKERNFSEQAHKYAEIRKDSKFEKIMSEIGDRRSHWILRLAMSKEFALSLVLNIHFF
jgi:hypothetical protein